MNADETRDFLDSDLDRLATDHGPRRGVVEHGADGVDRRGFLKCMAWAGTGLVWTVGAGLLSSTTLGQALAADAKTAKGAFTFVQLSDSHIGFQNEPNHDVTATFQMAVDRLKTLHNRPEFVIHTGDISHLSKPDQFDTVEQILKGAGVGQSFFVPGEHDTFVDNGQEFLRRHGAGNSGRGWQSFDYKGVHFVGLINVFDLKAGGFGTIGGDQLEWLKQDLAPLSTDTPVVVFAHVPLWAIYPQWGWGTDDAEQALSLLRRFSSVTVLNGHIHQVLQKVEGNVTFHTAASTAYPQPAPGKAEAPGPYRVRTDQLLSSLGVREVNYVQKPSSLVLVDQRLG
jgi:hypothetical protein